MGWEKCRVAEAENVLEGNLLLALPCWTCRLVLLSIGGDFGSRCRHAEAMGPVALWEVWLGICRIEAVPPVDARPAGRCPKEIACCHQLVYALMLLCNSDTQTFVEIGAASCVRLGNETALV